MSLHRSTNASGNPEFMLRSGLSTMLARSRLLGSQGLWASPRLHTTDGERNRLLQRRVIQKLPQNFADQLRLLPRRIMSRLRNHLQQAARNVLPHKFAVGDG